jgi:hypothetical protein
MDLRPVFFAPIRRPVAGFEHSGPSSCGRDLALKIHEFIAAGEAGALARRTTLKGDQKEPIYHASKVCRRLTGADIQAPITAMAMVMAGLLNLSAAIGSSFLTATSPKMRF